MMIRMRFHDLKKKRVKEMMMRDFDILLDTLHVTLLTLFLIYLYFFDFFVCSFLLYFVFFSLFFFSINKLDR